MAHYSQKLQTICWGCQNAVPDKHGRGCSWSKELIPVEGWTALKSRTSQGSYNVRECPEFVPDEPDDKTGTAQMLMETGPVKEAVAEDEPPESPDNWSGRIVWEDDKDRLEAEMRWFGLIK